MATVRVIAYTLHEHEHMAAGQALRNPIEGESYTIGEIDDSQIDGLRSQGLIVEPLDRDTAPSVGRPGVREMAVAGEAGGDFGFAGGGDEAMEGPLEAAPPPPPTATAPPPLAAGEEGLWVVRLGTPLLPGQQPQMDATGARIQ